MLSIMINLYDVKRAGKQQVYSVKSEGNSLMLEEDPAESDLGCSTTICFLTMKFRSTARPLVLS